MHSYTKCMGRNANSTHQLQHKTLMHVAHGQNMAHFIDQHIAQPTVRSGAAKCIGVVKAFSLPGQSAPQCKPYHGVQDIWASCGRTQGECEHKGEGKANSQNDCLTALPNQIQGGVHRIVHAHVRKPCARLRILKGKKHAAILTISLEISSFGIQMHVQGQTVRF